jgi:hypothetical protein
MAELPRVVRRPRFGYYSPLSTEAYWGPLMPTVISVSIWLPVSSVLSAYLSDRIRRLALYDTHCTLLVVLPVF